MAVHKRRVQLLLNMAVYKHHVISLHTKLDLSCWRTLARRGVTPPKIDQYLYL